MLGVYSAIWRAAYCPLAVAPVWVCPPSGSCKTKFGFSYPLPLFLKERWYLAKQEGKFSLLLVFPPDCTSIVWRCRFYSPLACYPYRGIRLPRWWFVPLTGSELPPVATLPGVRLKSFRFRLLSHSSPSVPVPAPVPGSPSGRI